MLRLASFGRYARRLSQSCPCLRGVGRYAGPPREVRFDALAEGIFRRVREAHGLDAAAIRALLKFRREIQPRYSRDAAGI